jgi:hypothetical protein
VSPTATGTYAVTFPQDVSNCVVVSTLAGDGPGQISAETTSSATNVTVTTFDDTGASQNRFFQVAAFC